jgi:hypothetical protein
MEIALLTGVVFIIIVFFVFNGIRLIFKSILPKDKND